MKSLKESLFDSKTQTMESLFDSDLVTKKLTFGDIFKLDEKYSSNWKYCPLDKQFSVQRIKSKTKVTGSDNCEIIFNGMVKLIENIKLEGSPEDMNKVWLSYRVEDVVWDFFRHGEVKKGVHVMFLDNGHLILDRDRSLFGDSFDTIQIIVGPELSLVFRRK